MSIGYIKVHRSMLEWEWYHDDRCVRLLLHLLLKANYTDRMWKGQALRPGQLITSTVSLAEQLGWSRSALNRTLDKLKSGHEIETHSDNKWTLITLRKWEQFQIEDSKPDSNRTANRTATGQQTGQQPDTAKEGEERKKEKKGRRTPEGVRAEAQPTLEFTLNGSAPPDEPGARPDNRDPNVQAVIDHLTDKLAERDLGLSLDGTVKENRFAAANLLRKLAKERPEHDPLESAKALIDFATGDDFHARNSTKVSYLFRNLAKLRNDAKARRNATKTMSDEQYRESVKQAAFERFGNR